MPDPSPTARLDRDLLRRAFPAGFLAVPGLATVGGWRCAGIGVHVGEPVWFTETPQERRLCSHLSGVIDVNIAEGDMLPLVDPADAGSWTIVIRDLAVACGLDVKGATGFAWWWTGRTWALTVTRENGPVEWHSRDDDEIADEDNPALALTLARIAVRERDGR